MTPVPREDPAAAADGDARLRLRLRVDFGAGARIGPGKADLIEAVDRTGSISAAGRAMGMSYRRAWLLVDAVNRMFDEPVVQTAAGGVQGGGAKVTDFGRRLVAAYRALEADCATAAEQRLGGFAARLSPDYRAPAGDPDG